MLVSEIGWTLNNISPNKVKIIQALKTSCGVRITEIEPVDRSRHDGSTRDSICGRPIDFEVTNHAITAYINTKLSEGDQVSR